MSTSCFPKPARGLRTRPRDLIPWHCAAGAILLVVAALPARSSGIVVLYQAPNTTITAGLAHQDVEFENPLAGTETVLGHPMLEWRDADYAAGMPPWYDDWTVAGAGTIDGNVNEIWMRQAGQTITTSTTVASRFISVHLIGDSNDGLADVQVDGVLVAKLDMGSNPLDRVIVLVSGLAPGTHLIQVNDLGAGLMGGTDVATFGAAALGPEPPLYKWNQPPQPAYPEHVYNGWDELSIYLGPQIGADDWVCETDAPVTKIRWWGSFLGWKETVPPQIPAAFHMTMWTDVPAGVDQPFSHPGMVVWELDCYSFVWRFAGWDYNPITHDIEATFLFEQDLLPHEYFLQENTNGIYWLSIAALYPMEQPTQYGWGWKTRPRDQSSPAPDDAVVIWAPTDPHVGMVYQAGASLWFPEPTDSWDFAFELMSTLPAEEVKFETPPDPSLPGLHAHESALSPGVMLADQWQCEGGAVHDLHWYGNYEIGPLGMEQRGSGVRAFHLSIHRNQPVAPWCLPSTELWTIEVPSAGVVETPTGLINIEGSPIYRYDYVGLPEPFAQVAGEVYWLDIIALAVNPIDPPMWRWQEGRRSPMPIICPAASRNYPMGTWSWVTWPGPRYSDMAFAVTSLASVEPVLKWSQPPVRYTGGEPFFNGWDEVSTFGGPQVVADDWVCSTETPVTDVHWWGSFLGWREMSPPSFALPGSFQLAIWTDVPAGVDQPFSHPGTVLWELPCVEYTWEFAGWDADPRDPLGLNLDSMFKFTCDLPEGAWFDQGPVNSIFWLSIAAIYPSGTPPVSPWGWKTTPRLDAQSPDDAVVVFDPLTPLIGMTYGSGAPLWWPTPESSWDAAFELTTRIVMPPEACCLPDGSCVDVTPDVCRQQSGVSQGPGTACSGVTIACCLPDGTCRNTDPLCCDELGGQPSPWGAAQCLGDLNGSGVDDACEAPTQACCLPSGSCADIDYMACVNQGGDPQGPGTYCSTLPYACRPIKWAQPPVYDEMPPRPECFNGWDEISHFACPGCQLVADDWLCSDPDPITDIHWWGSYVGWDEASGAPPVAPDLFHVGIWSDVKSSGVVPFSHPGELLWQWIVPRADLNERPVGCDLHSTHPRDMCFRYDFRLPDGEIEWFYQLPRPRVYWISISAVYPVGVPPAFPWGWKTRPHFWNDDAVVITAPNAPIPGDAYLTGFPIEEPAGVSWDMAFVLTTRRSLTPKWSQPMFDPYMNFDAASNLWLHDGETPPVPVAKWDQAPDPQWSGLHAHDETVLGVHRWTTLADDWICEGGEVRDVHWWGNYEVDDTGSEKRGQGIHHFHLSIHRSAPGTLFPPPQQLEAFGIDVAFAAANETWTGLFNSEGGRIYLYSFDLPTPFDQTQGQQYWLDITAFAVNPLQPAIWRWQEARRDIAPVLGLSPAVSRTASDLQPPTPWQFISWPPLPPGNQPRYGDMAFRITAGEVEEVNKVVADDFISDGRPIRALRWWGSYFDERYAEPGGFDPLRQLDGWLITFHWADNEIPYPSDPTCPPDLISGPDPPPTALGSYFVPRDAVLSVFLGIPDCLSHGVFEYFVDLSQACLVCSERDPRTNWYPAQPGSFNEQRGERYWISIQAVTGAEWRLPECGMTYTGHQPSDRPGNNGDFWGWLTTTNPTGGALLDEACVGEIVSWTPWPPNCWEYGNWGKQPYLCPMVPPQLVNMAFELLTPHAANGACCWPDGTCTDGSLAECGGFVCDVNNYLACAPNCVLGDVDGNGVVNAGDRGVISANFGQTAPHLVCMCDLDGNGVINPADRGVVSANIGLQTPLPDFQNGSGLNNGMPDGRFPPGGVFYGPGTDCTTVVCP